MNSGDAEDRLLVIRTLMERSALYRRALAPIMLLLGALGSVAPFLAIQLRMDDAASFARYWTGLSLFAVACAFFMVRRQAFKAGEPFWSPPARRVAHALLPALCLGFIVALPTVAGATEGISPAWLAILWIGLYGCGVHASSFFTPRGMRWLGWLFIVSAAGLAALLPGSDMCVRCAHLSMGGAFGGLHLLYGIYLVFTEKRTTNA